jgi:hypothetical protein
LRLPRRRSNSIVDGDPAALVEAGHRALEDTSA